MQNLISTQIIRSQNTEIWKKIDETFERIKSQQLPYQNILTYVHSGCLLESKLFCSQSEFQLFMKTESFHKYNVPL